MQIEHILNGKLLKNCTLDELSGYINEAEIWAACDRLNDREEELLQAVNEEFDGRSQNEKESFQKYWEENS